jgi:hypothetical protein
MLVIGAFSGVELRSVTAEFSHNGRRSRASARGLVWLLSSSASTASSAALEAWCRLDSGQGLRQAQEFVRGVAAAADADSREDGLPPRDSICPPKPTARWRSSCRASDTQTSARHARKHRHQDAAARLRPLSRRWVHGRQRPRSRGRPSLTTGADRWARRPGSAPSQSPDYGAK